MTQFANLFSPFAKRMRAEGLPELFIDNFAHYYEQLVHGHTGLIQESDIKAVSSLPDVESLPEQLAEVGEASLEKAVNIKLNGGLGTSMGLEQAKSLLEVREGLSFLDITARQSVGAGIPLILMNSFVTHADSLLAMDPYQQEMGKVPRAFLQHKQPKINQSDLSPAVWPQDSDLEWCPPGHGDIYIALVTSGTLDALLDAGYEYAFVSNSDNLGAVIDRRILGYFAQNKFPFMMEVADRTEMDKKGGHLARRLDGSLILREAAQTPPEDIATFQDITRHKYFNTNNLWLNLSALRQMMSDNDYRLGLSMIRNAKTVDPRDADSTQVYQLETAMGSAIGVFEGAQAVRVPRSRFAPVKKTNDLLAVRSDAYILTSDFHVVPNPERHLGQLIVELDTNYYKFVTDLEERFEEIPSFVACTYFGIVGDFKFGRHVVCRGDVQLINESGKQVFIPDGTHLSGEIRY